MRASPKFILNSRKLRNIRIMFAFSFLHNTEADLLEEEQCNIIVTII